MTVPHPVPGRSPYMDTDVVRGRGGSDFIYTDGNQAANGHQADRVSGGAGNDWIFSNHGQDRIDGRPGNDYVRAFGASNDVITGGTDDDLLWVEIGDTSGPPSYDGGPGIDAVQINTDTINPRGAASTATYNMVTGAMRFTLKDTTSPTVRTEQALLATRATSWTVRGTPGNDTVTMDPDSGSSTFYGLAGDDYFRGSSGDDLFDGGPGNDSASVGQGDDTCISVENINPPDRLGPDVRSLAQ